MTNIDRLNSLNLQDATRWIKNVHLKLASLGRLGNTYWKEKKIPDEEIKIIKHKSKEGEELQEIENEKKQRIY